VIKEKDFYVYSIVEERFSNISIAPVQSRGGSLVNNKYGSVTPLKNYSTKSLSPIDGLLIKHSIIGPKLFLKSNINFIRQFFYQSKFKPISKRHFETSEMMRILRHAMLFLGSDTFHKKFVQS
jgi:hypothetical protein